MSAEKPLTQFDPETVAHLEITMWQSYYNIKDRHLPLLEKVRATQDLFSSLTDLCQEQFQFSKQQSHKMAACLAAAAINFGLDKTNRYGLHEIISKPLLEKAYRLAQSSIGADFDPKKVAELELQWWQEDRQSHENPEKITDTISNMGKLFAEIYQYSDSPEMYVAALHRVTAAVKRNQQAATSPNWNEIGDHLVTCYTIIKKATTV